MWIPFFGWYARKARLIPVDRSAGLAALTRMTALAQKELERARQLIIFPEGTRRAPGAEPAYKPGVVHLYGKVGVACVPLALNSGLFWPRRSLPPLPGDDRRRGSRPDPAGPRPADVRRAVTEFDRDRDGTPRRRRRAATRRAIRGRAACATSRRWCTTRGLVKPLQPTCEQVQFGLAVAEFFERADGFKDVVAIGAGMAVALPHDSARLSAQREPPGILNMTAVDDVAKRPHLPPRFVFEFDPPHGFEIDRGDLLAFAQVLDRLVALRKRQPEMRCRGTSRRDRGRARARAAPAYRDGRKNRRKAPGAIL